eukprot:CAMPEP_0115346142 /NCGR_PEP_ID=MMETSP0270-20121206/94182_1 /TAXON_ID=71861 /ORGANISM="Scrippsiella trochoidea, Strain CCMP3099" /LENGTH=51 /DNA_ID=CAMNT_0002767963 /DNA_START=180 /DNA_END=332 /DNA_ORIENTATION=-
MSVRILVHEFEGFLWGLVGSILYEPGGSQTSSSWSPAAAADGAWFAPAGGA